MHDWGGLIGLRWACEQPDAVGGLVISATGFFPDGKWHGMAKALREPGTGEQVVAPHQPRPRSAPCCGSQRRDDRRRRSTSTGRPTPTTPRRRGQLELYRSGDFSKLEPYDLAGLGVPALLVWGRDEFAPVAGAHRFERELPDTELVVVEGAGHFVWDDAPAECAAALTGFLDRVRGSAARSS